MAIKVHNFTDFVNLQTVCKSTDLKVYKSPKYGFSFAFNIPGKIATSSKHNCGCNMFKIIFLKKSIQIHCRGAHWPSG